ncbi:MAG TPA: hypothetical protein PL163_07100 [Leptospiraceae bacterium]|nr:hypothetical protein [Leptospiraceae bacterium]
MMIRFLLLAGISLSAYADTILMGDGTSITQSCLLEQSNSFLIYKDSKGNVKTLERKEVRSVIIDPGTCPDVGLGSGKITVADEAGKETVFNGYKSGGQEPKGEKKDTNGVNIEIMHEFVTDFIWRGNSYGGEFRARRDGTRYKEISQYYAYQPNIKVAAPSGLYFELWGNIPLMGRGDRDSDHRFQSSPGGAAVNPVALVDRLSNNQVVSADQSSLFFDPSNNVFNSTCSDPAAALATLQTTPGSRTDCQVDLRKVKRHKERNGLYRTDGLFTTFAYNFDAGKFGTFTMGTWWYFQNDKQARYSWQEYFIWWDLPFLKKYLSPKLQVYTQSSQDLSAYADGSNYASFQTKHTFTVKESNGWKFQIEPNNNIGYKYANDNSNRKSGFFDITTGLKFILNDFFLTVNDAYRPDVHLYDNSVFYYDTSNPGRALPNLNQYDGKTADPSKLYGFKNDLFYNGISAAGLDPMLALYATQKYQEQKIPRHLIWFSLGYTQNF